MEFQDTLSRDEAARVIDRARQWWAACLFAPPFYLALAYGAFHLWMEESPGLCPLSPQGYRWLLVAFIALALIAQAALVLIGRSYAARAEKARSGPEQVKFFYERRLLYQAVCADLVSGLGLIAFLIQGETTALVALLGASYLLYAQAYPKPVASGGGNGCVTAREQ